MMNDDDDVRFELDQYAQLDFYLCVSSLKQQQTSHSSRTYYPDSGPTSLYAFFLMLRAQQQLPILPLWYLQTLLTNPRSTILEASMLTISQPIWQKHDEGLNFYTSKKLKITKKNPSHLTWKQIHQFSVIQSDLITGVVLKVHVEQELRTLPEDLSSPHVINEVRVAQSLFFCVMFCRSLFVLLSSVWSVLLSIYGFWLFL